MDLTKVLRILSTNAKAAAIAGIAVAATAGGGAVVATTVADSSPATTTITTHGSGDDANEAPDVKDSESPDANESESPDAEDAGKTTVTPVDCGTTAWANHGAYVSSVAHSTPPAGTSHGDMVSAAAQSDCGKPTPGSTDAPKASHSPQGDSHRNSNATKHQSATHGKSATHKHH